MMLTRVRIELRLQILELMAMWTLPKAASEEQKQTLTQLTTQLEKVRLGFIRFGILAYPCSSGWPKSDRRKRALTSAWTSTISQHSYVCYSRSLQTLLMLRM